MLARPRLERLGRGEARDPRQHAAVGAGQDLGVTDHRRRQVAAERQLVAAAGLLEELGDAEGVRRAFRRAVLSRPQQMSELSLRVHVLDVLFDMEHAEGAAEEKPAEAPAEPAKAEATAAAGEEKKEG